MPREGEFGTDAVGNVRFEFFTCMGSLSVEAWRSTRSCKVTTFSRGLRRRTEVRLSDKQWHHLSICICSSCFWKWMKRYDIHSHSGYAPSWSLNVFTDAGWFYSSGDGAFPEGFAELLRGMVSFAAEIEGVEYVPAGVFLASFTGEGEA